MDNMGPNQNIGQSADKGFLEFPSKTAFNNLVAYTNEVLEEERARIAREMHSQPKSKTDRP